MELSGCRGQARARMLGVMTHQKVARGIFIATGDYTKEAIEFAKANPIDLISGPAFLDMIRRLSDDARKRLLDVAITGDYTTPTCPSCGIKMIRRTGYEANSGGASTFQAASTRFP